jgi:hypothetical protein
MMRAHSERERCVLGTLRFAQPTVVAGIRVADLNIDISEVKS